MAAFVDRLRAKLIGLGYHLGPFRLHVTLARVPAGSIGLDALLHRIDSVAVPQISSPLTKADYRKRRWWSISGTTIDTRASAPCSGYRSQD